MRASVLLSVLLLFPGVSRAFDFKKALKSAGDAAEKMEKAAQRKEVQETFKTLKDVREAVDITPEREAAIGREVASNLVAKYGLVREQSLQRYVSSVGAQVSRFSGRKGVEYRFGVLESDFVGAWASPGGWILITRGLLSRLENEAQLAGVLAHEVAHVELDHGIAALRKTGALGAVLDGVGRSVKEKDLVDGVSELVIRHVERGRSRSDELEADERGAALASEAGYDGAGLVYALKKIDGAQPGCGGYYSDKHPPARDRLARLSENPVSEKRGAVLGKRFRASLPRENQ